MCLNKKSQKVWVIQAHRDFSGSEVFGLAFNVRDAKDLAKEVRRDYGFWRPLKWWKDSFGDYHAQRNVEDYIESGSCPDSYAIEKMPIYRRQPSQSPTLPKTGKPSQMPGGK